MSKIFKLIGTILLLVIYLISGINKVFTFNETVDKIKKKFIFNNLPKVISQLGILVIIFVWVLGSLLLIYSVHSKNKTLGILTNSLFIILTTIVTFYFHSPFEKGQEIQFMKNLSIISGFIILLSDFLEM